MTEETSSGKKLQWHPAFFAGIQIELAEDADNLTFENEHQLGTKPMEIDVLIIKKQKDEPIRKNIGRIFKGHNIVEYKSPEDYLSIDDFYKVMGYACFYKSDVQKVDMIKAEEITLTFVCKGYPGKLAEHLKTIRKFEIAPQTEGIYYILGGMFPVQLVVTSKLSEEENFWLRNLTNELKGKEDAAKVVEKYSDHKDSHLHKSVMDIIVRANEERFKEVRGTMCDALMELMQDVIKDELEESRKQGMNLGKTEGREEGLKEGLKEGRQRMLLEQISKKLAKGKSIEQIADELEETEENIRELIALMEV